MEKPDSVSSAVEDVEDIELDIVSTATPSATPISVDNVSSPTPIDVDNVSNPTPIDVDGVSNPTPIDVDSVSNPTPIDVDSVSNSTPIDVDIVDTPTCSISEVTVDENRNETQGNSDKPDPDTGT